MIKCSLPGNDVDVKKKAAASRIMTRFTGLDCRRLRENR